METDFRTTILRFLVELGGLAVQPSSLPTAQRLPLLLRLAVLCLFSPILHNLRIFGHKEHKKPDFIIPKRSHR
jgi:hypothetical protein